MPDQQSNKITYKYILVALLLIFGFFIVREMRPYLGGFLGAFTLYVILRNQVKFLVEKKRFNRALAASLILLEALLVFLLPLAGTAALVADQLSGLTIDLESIKTSAAAFLAMVKDTVGIDFINLDFLSFLPKLGTNVVQVLAANSYSFVVNSLVIIFVLYFMLYSYQDFETMVREILPFSPKNKLTFISESKSIITANAIGIPLLALVQGTFAYIGYLIFGVSSPMVYAIITAFATILPLVGTAIVYIPLALVFLFNGQYGAAIGMALYGMLVIGSVDNVVRFLLQKQIADIHPLITVFGVLIGLPMFGFWGIIFGPLILSLFMLFFDMYRHDYIPNSTAHPHTTSEIKERNLTKLKFDFFKKKNKQ